MKIVPNYKKSAFIVPGAALDVLDRADRCDLAVLLYTMGKEEFNLTEAADVLGIGENDFLSSVKFWEECGIMSASRGKASRKKDEEAPALPEKKKKPALRSALPSYTTEETAAFLEKNRKAASVIDSCESIIGKIFTTAETAIIIGMMDHLSLSGDYILLLFAHAARIEKRSVRYVEKMALGFVDKDITSYRELEAELAYAQLTEDTVKKVRKLFGLGSRTLIKKERDMVHNWCVTWGYGPDIIELAYEITVNNTKKASLSYANKILENWFKEGLKAYDQIKASLDAKEAEKTKAKESGGLGSSFDTDDFFEAALKRSYGEDTRN